MSPDRQFLFHNMGGSVWRRQLQRQYSHRSYHIPHLEVDTPTLEHFIRVNVQKHPTKLNTTSVSHQPTTLPQDTTEFLVFDKITIISPQSSLVYG